MAQLTFKEALMSATTVEETRAYARLVFINPANPEDVSVAQQILKNDLTLEEVKALFKST